MDRLGLGRVTGGVSVFPAHAGMDRFPRLALNKAFPCSPHTRGWTDRGTLVYDGPAVFPAHAGMDRA